jgi:ubiquinone/menaquinone biosynthesis C-methylase UbiE
MKRSHSLSLALLTRTTVVVALCLLPNSVRQTTAQESAAQRERDERVSDILAALGVREGLYVADVGSNDGFYTIRVARAVGPAGRAFAVDISTAALDRLRERIARDQISNLEPVLAAPNDPKLPTEAIDAVLIRNAYHEMPEYRGVLAGITRALKPGGILVIVEPIRDDRRLLPREEQVKEHEIAPELVEADLREAGFEVLERRERFTEAPKRPGGGFWLIRARRP